MLGGMTVMTTLLTRTMTASIGGLRGEMSGLRGEMNGRFDGLRGEMDASISGLRAEMNARFDAMGTRIDHLDKDIAALSRRVWGEPSGE
ncbi:MAG: hypothetical protein BGO47_07650 [Microbacterium sp. 67-17]|nr:MAG: hypothetical protein BGO47_07650 [Microbacterium sp. 67-17]